MYIEGPKVDICKIVDFKIETISVVSKSRRVGGAWKPHFAWLPVRVNGKVAWLRKVYRCHKIDMEGAKIKTTWVYGELFDVLKGEYGS